jgi:hypothetical protein
LCFETSFPNISNTSIFLVLLSIPKCFGQTTFYEFESIDKRINKGEVQFSKDKVNILTEETVYEFWIINESYWVSDSTIMLFCNDSVGRNVIIRLLVNPKERMNSENIELIFYFENKESIYHKINLTKCKN